MTATERSRPATTSTPATSGPAPTDRGHPDWRKVGLAAAVLVTFMLVMTGVKDPVTTEYLDIDDTGFGMPKPPLFASDPAFDDYSRTNTTIAIVWLSCVGLVAFGLAIRDFMKTRTVLALFVTASAPMIVFPEVFFDVMGAVFYPVSEGDNAFTIFGRQMGWFIVAGWFGFGSLFMYTTYKVVEARMSTKAIWLSFVAACIGATVFEEILQNMGGMYFYYGNQPLIVLWKLPWWWTPLNAGGVFLAASLAYRFRHELRGWRGLLMFVITPASMAGSYAFAAMPAWMVVNGDYNWWLTQMAGLATIVIGIGAVALVIRLVLDRDPWNWSGNDAGHGVGGAPEETEQVLA